MEVREGMVGHTGGPAEFKRPSFIFGRDWETFPEFQEGSGGPPGGPGGVARPSCRSAMGPEALPKVREA